ncbi:MAG: hypothetical protein GQ532_02135 [Methylomarinum sp.]|nr:hypothetical protein [Methylomarinum sp.]
MSLGQLGLGLKVMSSSAKSMLFDLYQIREGDHKYLFYRKSGDYVEFFTTMLEKAGNPNQYREIRLLSGFKKGSFNEYEESLKIAENTFIEENDKKTKKYSTPDFKIYCAIALIECQKQAVKLINATEENVSSDTAGRIATMTGYIYACFFMLSTDKAEDKVKSKSQSDRALAGGEKRKAEILTEAISILKGETSRFYFWDTENKEPGSLRIGSLSREISNRVEIKSPQITSHLKTLIQSNRLDPKKYYKKS